jgi:diacylglycerol kinase family enzyme
MAQGERLRPTTVAGERPGGARPAAIFLNRAAASAGSRRVQRAVELTRHVLDADLHVADTRDHDELVAWMDERIGEYGTVVVAGGDGTLAIAYNLAAGRQELALGYIPGGFGNATAHLLRLPRDPAALAAVVARGETRPIDLVDANGRLALFAGLGWDALVAQRYAEGGARRLVGWAGAIGRSLPDLLRRTAVEVLADGEVIHTGPMELLVVSTTPWYGRGLLVNPDARPDRGRLTLRVYAGPLPRFALEAARWFAHRHPGVPGVSVGEVVVRAAGDEPLPVQADGDVIGRRAEWRFVVRPAAVRLIGRW